VLPIFVVTVAVFGLFVSYPFEALALTTILFLGTIPVSMARYRQLERAHAAAEPAVEGPGRLTVSSSRPLRLERDAAFVMERARY
jgi:CDP-diacylglycerol--serine O-phosphatidyltransferase